MDAERQGDGEWDDNIPITPFTEIVRKYGKPCEDFVWAEDEIIPLKTQDGKHIFAPSDEGGKYLLYDPETETMEILEAWEYLLKYDKMRLVDKNGPIIPDFDFAGWGW